MDTKLKTSIGQPDAVLFFHDMATMNYIWNTAMLAYNSHRFPLESGYKPKDIITEFFLRAYDNYQMPNPLLGIHDPVNINAFRKYSQISIEGIATNRSQRLNKRSSFIDKSVTIESLEGEAFLDESGVYELVHGLLESLNVEKPTQAEAITLKYLHGFKLQEVADYLNVSLATAKRYISQGLNWMRHIADPVSYDALN